MDDVLGKGVNRQQQPSKQGVGGSQCLKSNRINPVQANDRLALELVLSTIASKRNDQFRSLTRKEDFTFRVDQDLATAIEFEDKRAEWPPFEFGFKILNLHLCSSKASFLEQDSDDEIQVCARRLCKVKIV